MALIRPLAWEHACAAALKRKEKPTFEPAPLQLDFPVISLFPMISYDLHVSTKRTVIFILPSLLHSPGLNQCLVHNYSGTHASPLLCCSTAFGQRCHFLALCLVSSQKPSLMLLTHKTGRAGALLCFQNPLCFFQYGTCS